MDFTRPKPRRPGVRLVNPVSSVLRESTKLTNFLGKSKVLVDHIRISLRILRSIGLSDSNRRDTLWRRKTPVKCLVLWLWDHWFTINFRVTLNRYRTVSPRRLRDMFKGFDISLNVSSLMYTSSTTHMLRVSRQSFIIYLRYTTSLILTLGISTWRPRRRFVPVRVGSTHWNVL